MPLRSSTTPPAYRFNLFDIHTEKRGDVTRHRLVPMLAAAVDGDPATEVPAHLEVPR